ncbi:MAG TPA: PIN domain-containing protein [Xanthobacteraceae bacterium]|nr:PIN domain-containing protein [Xanthobacteraceae bacterium]
MTFIDTNVLLDVATDDPRWARWSLRQLDLAATRGRLLINAVVYAEFSIGYSLIEEADRVVAAVGLHLTEMPRAALFLAGKVFQRYRAQGGSRTGVLPDFFIGAHAAVTQVPLLTRDPRPYRTYFSGIAIIAPDTGESA